MAENIFLPVQNLQRTPIKHFGLCWILFFKHRDILNWPSMDPQNGVINAALVFKSDAVFYSAQFIEKDRIFKEDQRESIAGPFVESTVSGTLGGNNLNHISGITAMMGGQFGCLIQERNGEQRLIGRQDAGAKFSWDYTSGSDSNSRKRNCKWTYESEFPVPIYQGGNVVIDNTIIPVGGNTAGGSGSFDLLTRFIVGDPGAPMTNGDVTFSHPALVNKKVIVMADGMPIPQPPYAVITKRTITKIYNQDTITFNGGVVAPEIIEIFIY
jgi:hypothetical protein